MNTTQIKAMLQSKRIQAQITEAVTNVFYRGHSNTHIVNRFGKAVLSFKKVDGKLSVYDNKKDVTQAYMMATKGV